MERLLVTNTRIVGSPLLRQTQAGLITSRDGSALNFNDFPLGQCVDGDIMGILGHELSWWIHSNLL